MQNPEAIKAQLQDKIDQKLQNAVNSIQDLQDICIANQALTDADPEKFSRLIDQLIDLRPRVIL